MHDSASVCILHGGGNSDWLSSDMKLVVKVEDDNECDNINDIGGYLLHISFYNSCTGKSRESAGHMHEHEP